MAFQKFSISEAIIVVLIVVLLGAVILPILTTTHRPSGRIAALTQLATLDSACESYRLAFGKAPGYFDEATLDPRQFTGNENLVLSLLGGPVRVESDAGHIDESMPSTPDGWTIDVARLGTGPQAIDGRSYGAFYSPKPDELAVVTGTLGPDNSIPELVDRRSGSPILYFRFDPEHDSNLTVGDDDGAAFSRNANIDYIDAKSLSGPAGPVSVRNSLLRSDRVGGAAAANTLLAGLATDPSLPEHPGAWLLISPGPDGVWFDASDYPDNAPPDPHNYVDIWRVGG